MTQTSETLVGNSFRLGYRFQRYWDMSMACAFFSAETGAGLFMAATLTGHTPGMILGLILVGTLKPYFHLAHMGVPKKSWRAIIRPDRSWISRGTLSIGLLVACGVLHVAHEWLGLPTFLATLAQGGAMAGALLVMCYQGFAMSDSDSLALWASPLVPLISFTYAATAGSLCLLVLAGGALGEAATTLRALTVVLLLADAAVLAALLSAARRKSKGGAFSVELLTKGQFATLFRQRVIGAGLVAPLLLMLAVGGYRVGALLATASMLFGFFTFRLLILRAAVFEPITQDLAGSLGLPLPR